MLNQVFFVDYLVLGEKLYLMVNECINCGVRFFDCCNVCVNCFGIEFKKVDVVIDGEVCVFIIVVYVVVGIFILFVLVVVDCGGILVCVNIINIELDLDYVFFGMKVCFVIYFLGKDVSGIEVVGFGFELVV